MFLERLNIVKYPVQSWDVTLEEIGDLRARSIAATHFA